MEAQSISDPTPLDNPLEAISDPLVQAFSTLTLQDFGDAGWNMDTGHLGSEVLRFLISNSSILCNKTKSPELCHTCQLGKHVRLPFVSSDSIVNSPFDIVHLDLWTSPLPSLSGIKYYCSKKERHGDVKAALRREAWPPRYEMDQAVESRRGARRGMKRRDKASKGVGVGCDETFSHVVKPATIRTVLSLAASRHWLVHQLDVKNAFLHAVSLWSQAGPEGLGSYTAYLLLYVDDILLTASSTTLLLYQYALEILERDGMLNCQPSRTSVDTETKLGANGIPVFDPILFCSLARALQYLTFTRPDLSYAVQQVCLYMHDPRKPHLAALKRILRYVRGTTTMESIFMLHPRSLYIEAEYRGVANVVADTAWIHNLLRELQSPLSTATLVYYDNVAAGHVRVLHVPSRYQFVDIFTKGLPYALFDDFRTSLNVRPSPAPTTGAC
ncbi:ribonuclease H-like domain-containing protein [Tanacetum coccineum]